jgi:hypothetical protein
MKRVTFKAWHGDHYLSLWDILTELRDVVENLQWRVRIDETAPSPQAERLEAIDHDAWLDTAGLLGIATRDVQVIDGEASGYKTAQSGSPYLTIRAVDSTWWDVESDDEGVTRTVMSRFPDVQPTQ